jgi:hypothetical protein
MNPESENELTAAIKSELPLGEVVALLRKYKDRGIAQADVYSFLERFRLATDDDAMDDRILEVADFVAGFCSPHMKIWDGEIAETTRLT